VHCGQFTDIFVLSIQLATTVAARQAPGIDPLVYAVYMVLKSVHNTVIEGFWRWLRGKMGLTLKEFITCGEWDRVFDSNVAFHV
jgi:hypothetical protein